MSNNLGPIFQEGDKVFYTGTKFKMDLTSKEGKPYVGTIHAKVVNRPDYYVVEYPDTKEGDSYVMNAAVLSKYRPAKVEHQRTDGPEVQQRPRRKRNTEEE